MEERTVLVVADGGGVRIFLEGHRGGPLSEKTAELGVPHPHAPASGSPGRVFDRFGHASHGWCQSNGNSSLVRRNEPKPRRRQAISDRHSAKAEERRSR